MHQKQLTLRQKVGYSLGSIGECIAFNLYYTFFLIFMTNVAGVDSAVAGVISMVSVLWDAITDPLVGHLSDKSKNPKGKRRPFILRGVIPMCVVMVLLFTNCEALSPVVKAIYFVVLNIFYWLFFTMADVPYITLGGEISDCPEDRLTIRSLSTSFFYVGALFVSSGTLLIVGKFTQLTGSANSGWSISASIMAVIVLICYLVAVAATKGKDKPATHDEAESLQSQRRSNTLVNMCKSLAASFKVKPFRMITMYQFFSTLSAMLMTTGIMYFCYYVIGYTDAQIAVVTACYSIGVALLSPVLGKISSVAGKKESLLVCSALIAAALLAYGTIIPINISTVIVFWVAVAFSVGSNYTISYAMIYDVAEVSSLKTGSENSGVLVSTFLFSKKIASSLAMLSVGLILKLFSYDPLNITAHTQTGINLAVVWLPAVAVLVAMLCVVPYTLNTKTMKSLKLIKEKVETNEELTAEEKNLIAKKL